MSGVTLTSGAGDVNVTATPEAWVLAVGEGGRSARVPPPITPADREAVLALAASLTEPLWTGAPAAPSLGGPPAGARRPLREGRAVAKRERMTVAVVEVAKLQSPPATPAPPPPPPPAPPPPPTATLVAVATPLAVPSPAPLLPPAALAPVAPAEPNPVVRAAGRRMPYAATDGGLVLRMDGGLAGAVGVAGGLRLSPSIAAGLRGRYFSRSDVPPSAGVGDVESGALTLEVRAGTTIFGRAGAGAALMHYREAGEDRGTVFAPVLDAGLGASVPLGPLRLAPELNLRVDLAATSITRGDALVASVSPLWLGAALGFEIGDP